MSTTVSAAAAASIRSILAANGDDTAFARDIIEMLEDGWSRIEIRTVTGPRVFDAMVAAHIVR